MRRVSSNIVSVKSIRVIAVALLMLVAGPLYILPAQQVQADTLDQRSLTMASSIPGATTRYQFVFTIPTSGPLGSIEFEFCDNTPLFGQPCTPPAGFNISAATLFSQGGEVGFNVDSGLTTANKLVISRSPSMTLGGLVGYTFDGVINGSNSGISYGRFSTYPTSDTSGPATDQGAVAYQLTPQFSLSAEVPPFLELCVGVIISGIDCTTASGDYVDMGDFVTTRASTGRTQMVVSTNADFGYAISASGNTMTSGNNVIPSLASPTVSIPGTSQFGINLRANNSPVVGEEPGGNGLGQPTANYNIPNRFTYVPGAIIATHNDVEDHRKYTVSYLVNINRNQPPGIYSSTFTYTATGSF